MFQSLKVSNNFIENPTWKQNSESSGIYRGKNIFCEDFPWIQSKNIGTKNLVELHERRYLTEQRPSLARGWQNCWASIKLAAAQQRPKTLLPDIISRNLKACSVWRMREACLNKRVRVVAIGIIPWNKKGNSLAENTMGFEFTR